VSLTALHGLWSFTAVLLSPSLWCSFHTLCHPAACRSIQTFDKMIPGRRTRIAVQALKLVLYAAIVVARARAVSEGPTCEGKCGRSFLSDSAGGHCHCDYWCNNRNDCCGGSASKDELCPHLR
jgi:hypothetical protein